MTHRDKLIAAGVLNLKEFGYEKVTPENIMTDFVYRSFFLSMLKDSEEPRPPLMDELIAEIEALGNAI